MKFLVCSLVLGSLLFACSSEPDNARTSGQEVAEKKSDECPTLSPPHPDFCDGGKPTPIYDGACVAGYECKSDADECPTLSPPHPDFCADGGVETPIYDGKCVAGYECKTDAGECPEVVKPHPDVCGGAWATMTPVYDGECIVGYDCCPGIAHPNPDYFCDGGAMTPVYDGACLVGYDCK